MVSRLNPRSLLVIDTHLLGRSPGSMKEYNRVIPAPVHFGTDVLMVTEGANMIVELRAESVMEGVYVSGRLKALAYGECSRCLEPLEHHINQPLAELFLYPGRNVPGDEEEALPELDGELIDIEPLLRDAGLLELPFTPLCQKDCQGLCGQCGVRLADVSDHSHEDLDPRWAALTALAADSTEDTTSDESGQESDQSARSEES